MSFKKILCGFFIYTLCGCNDQQYVSEINSELGIWANKAHCFAIRKQDFSFPKDIKQALTSSDLATSIVKKQPSDTNQVKQTLDSFVNLGLITRQSIPYDNTQDLIINRYTLTPEGRKYWQKKTSSFCFGSIKAIKVTGVTDGKVYLYQSRKIDYDYQIENIPNWARQDTFYQIYDINPDDYSDRIHSTSAIYDKERARYLALQSSHGIIREGFLGYPQTSWPENK
ncbi:hypothetical protein B9037_023460 [Klebsiella aerogenes]|uniref:hypothetical protein n=1 Tax=Klebsiella aerogenes TaxID=548 RepID=UPI000B41E040|nr:hypothetical protein [Klebsiella aerogenes]MEB7638731.1 hypothetical protein [Klebsiella aerogenes]RNT24362.1 hypothetical protein B9037_023460 [Klebsiella aerogenes]HDS4948177.1 hypothetical protein [Klebsiella aerogenes]